MKISRIQLAILLLIVICGAVFSSFTLWLIEPWIKYPLFVFELFTIVVLYLIFNDFNFKLDLLKSIKIERLRVGLVIDTLLILSAASLVLFNALSVQGGLVQLVLSLLVTSILPGYALLNIFGLNRYFSRLERLVLSYILSFAFTGLMALGFLFVSENVRLYCVLSVFILSGTVSLLKRRREVSSQTLRSFARNVDSLGIIVAIASLALSLYFMYPGFALLSGTDIWQHYGSSVLLWRSPELYGGFNYFLAHLHESVFVVASGASAAFIQTALATLNLILPLAFYVMAKSYLESIDNRLPVVSTIFYSMFSGFAWIYLVKFKLDGVAGSELSLFSLVNASAYNGAMYLAQPLLWFVPLSVSFTILIVQFMLLRKLNFGKGPFVALFSLLTIVNYMTHVTEAIIFSLFLCFYAFFSRSKTVRLNDALQASIIGFIFVIAFNIMLQFFLGKALGFSLPILFIVTIVMSIVYVYKTLKIQDKLIAVLPKLSGKFPVKLLVYLVTFVYLLGLVAWVGGIPSFHTSLLVDVGPIPWFIYPVFLGVGGALVMISLYFLLEDHEAMRLVMPFLALMIFSVLFGRALTFINVNLFDTGYWEKRFTSYFFLASAIIAPIAMVKAADSVRRHQARIKRALLVATIVSVVTVYGLQSFFVVTEYWFTVTAPAYQISEGEFQAINYLSSVLQQDKYAYTITLTSKSYAALTFAAPPYQLSGMQFFSTSENPETPLACLKAHNLTHAFLYLNNRDYAQLNETSQSWLATHLLPTLPIIYRNAEATIFNISSVSFPQTNSTTALVVPFDKSISPSKPWLYAYDVLSLGAYGYTVAYDLDSTIFSHDSLVLSIDLPSENVVEKNFEDRFSAGNGWQPISGTWQYVEGGLQAGKLGEYQDAKFLSPVSAQNFTASINFTPIDGDTEVANYVSLIYDWIDKTNYKCAGLMFDGNGNVYAYFSSYVNGQLTSYPVWPGSKTDLKWQFGDSFNVTVSANGENTILNINGSQYLSTKSRITGGLLGIGTTRFYQVLFTGFDSVSCNDVQLRNVDDYLEYVKAGGRLVVLNTNGHGYFADMLLASDNLNMTPYMISGSENISLPPNLTVSKLSPKSEKVDILAYYRSKENSSVYAVKEDVGAGEVIYVNLYPIINAIDQSSDKASFYKLMGDLLKSTNVQLESFTYVSEISSAFRQVTMSGDVNVTSSSLMFPLNVNFRKLSVTFPNDSVTSMVNVKQIAMSDYVNITLAASRLTFSGGNGFYATLQFGCNLTITPESNSLHVRISTSDGNTTHLTAIKTITISDFDSITLYMRQPIISAQGLIVFKELYSTRDILQETRTLGQDLIVNGSIRLTPYLSDVYTWATLSDVSGSLQRNPPILVYDELLSLPQAAFWSLLLVPTFLIMAFIVKERERKTVKRSV